MSILIPFAQTTNRSIRLDGNATDSMRSTALERVTTCLRETEDATVRIPVSKLFNSVLSQDGTIGGMKFTKHGFNSFASRLCGGLGKTLSVIGATKGTFEDNVGMQRKLFNDVWMHRSETMKDMVVTVDTRENKIDAVTSVHYGHFSNIEALEMMLSQNAQYRLEWGTLRGRKFDMGISDPNNSITIPTARDAKETSVIAKYLTNSEDGTSSLSAGIALYTLICTNGMRIMSDEMNMVRAIHRKNIRNNVMGQISRLDDSGFGDMLGQIKFASEIELNDAKLEKHRNWIGARVGKRETAAMVNKTATFDSNRNPTIYEVMSALTQNAHETKDLDRQKELETVAFEYLNYATAS